MGTFFARIKRPSREGGVSDSGEGPLGGAMSRRSFLVAAMASSAAVALPRSLFAGRLVSEHALADAASGPTPLPGGPYFLSHSYTDPSTGNVHDLYAIAAAACAQIIPTATNLRTGNVKSPGANEAGTVNYIDLFMAAFQPNLLSSGLVSTNPIYLGGGFSGRYNYGDSSPTARKLERKGSGPNTFETSSSGQPETIRFLELTDAQLAAWYLRVYGPPSSTSSPPWPSWSSPAWQSADASGLIPGAQPLQPIYEAGLSALDDWSNQNFSTGFATALPIEQEALIAQAGNPALEAVAGESPPQLPSPLINPVPPAAVATLYPILALHTIQGTYGLPEYRGQADVAVNGTGTEPTPGTIWADVGFDGDTQPLGNSVYKYDAHNDLNAGYPSLTYTDAAGHPQPQGGYSEFRPISTLDDSDTTLATVAEIATLFTALVDAGILTVIEGGPL
jgi:hypothetical protein